ncbi:hypothetical protein AYO45_02515 [Gammaproteobacteria bacterium SCGC AG-212-F23]|nr:hypothetical protein AYO45_02515 [Gammaproteobacteria bacterium SCGC AG-212-F23]
MLQPWIPEQEFIETTNIYQYMLSLQMTDIAVFHRWTVEHYVEFWEKMLKQLAIVFQQTPKAICDLSLGSENPRWLPGAKMNISDSCFTAPSHKTALIFQDQDKQIKTISYSDLQKYVNRIANSLSQQGFKPRDAIAIVMPMTVTAIAIYLAVIKIGGVVVSIADSFSAEEIATRLQIANTKAVFTQDIILRDQKELPLYEKIVAAKTPCIIVIPSTAVILNRAFCGEGSPAYREIPRYARDDSYARDDTVQRENDLLWEEFLVENDQYTSYACEPMDACNILFSSGTTGTPKAIPWNHTTPLKTASDGFFHQNIQADDIITWPTSLGWMMGPWLIFAAMINHATIALYTDVPQKPAFGKFIQDAGVTILGVVPTLVATWRQSHCMEAFDWQRIKLFTSTGECSNADDMAYLMSLARNKPVIEYCGGTEIGGAYLSSTVIQKNYPACFSTQAMGNDFVLLEDNAKSSVETGSREIPAESMRGAGRRVFKGEVALRSPAMGLSTELLNADHQKIYFENMPMDANDVRLRRHGDQLQQLANGYYVVIGRVDDTMNLGGIKTSAVEIERALKGIDNIIETAAIAIQPEDNGPSRLIIFAVTQENLDKNAVKLQMQKKINQLLNPLFKIYDVVFVKELPKTASNKIMRKELKKHYVQ